MRIAAKLWDCIAGGPETVINAHRLQSGLPLDCYMLFSQKPHVAFHFVGISPTLLSQHLLLCPPDFFNSPKSLSAMSWKTRRTSS